MIIATHTSIETAMVVQKIPSAVEFTAEKYEWLLPAAENSEALSKLQGKSHIRNALYPQNMVLDIFACSGKNCEYVFYTSCK